jgi:prephenate dehydratase
MRAAYLGPAGTFSEEALEASAPAGTRPVPTATVHDAVMAVQRGEAERALVPIESAAEGSVDATLDTLAFHAPDVVIVGEVVRPVHHQLIGQPGTDPAAIRCVVSHPQAAGQCAAFLRERLPDAQVLPASSTAEAVRLAVAREDSSWAAIGSARAAELYGGAVLAGEVADHEGNATRFVWLAPAGTAPDAAATRTSLVFWGTGAGAPGWLVRCLSEFAFRGVNLTRIESRPRRERLGTYMFFVDLDGDGAAGPVAEAVGGLRQHADEVRVLGSYPAS